MSGTTPYNSIYEAMIGGGCPIGDPEDGTVVCCAHGRKCDSDASEPSEKKNKWKKLQLKTDESGEEEGLYINLVDRDEGAKSLRKQLEGLSLLSKRQKKKDKKRKSRKTADRSSKVTKSEWDNRKTNSTTLSSTSGKSKKQRKRDGSAKRKEGRRKTSTRSNDGLKCCEEENPALKAYLGAQTFEEAEAAVQEVTDFRLYHRIESRKIIDHLTEEATLHMVYRTIHGDYRHYPIRQRTNGDAKMLFIDYGDPRAQTQSTLDELVRFFRSNVQMHEKNMDIGHQKNME